MVFYHSVREPSVSQECSGGRRNSELLRYVECSPIRTGLTDTLNIKHQLELEQENLEAISLKSAIGKRFGSLQRENDFQGQTWACAEPKSNATASLTKLNPKANPFTPRPIEWDKLPLRPIDPALYSSVDLEFNERSVHSPIAESVSFDFSDVMFNRFMQPYPMEVSLQETRAFNFPEYEPMDQQQMSGVDRRIFQDSAFVDSRDMTNPTEKMNYSETKCYHCGCVGHLAVECYMRKQGFDAVCFHCCCTGHNAANCPKQEEIRMVDIHSPVKYKTDPDNETNTKGITAKFGKMDIGERTWNLYSDLASATNARE